MSKDFSRRGFIKAVGAGAAAAATPLVLSGCATDAAPPSRSGV
jgi:hypothetical protein